MIYMLQNIFNLGIIVDKNNNICNHRTPVKIFFNPILLVFGYCICSVFDKNSNFVNYKLVTRKKQLNIIENYYKSIFYK